MYSNSLYNTRSTSVSQRKKNYWEILAALYTVSTYFIRAFDGSKDFIKEYSNVLWIWFSGDVKIFLHIYKRTYWIWDVLLRAGALAFRRASINTKNGRYLNIIFDKSYLKPYVCSGMVMGFFFFHVIDNVAELKYSSNFLCENLCIMKTSF